MDDRDAESLGLALQSKGEVFSFPAADLAIFMSQLPLFMDVN
jgi:hypothetical protein